MFFVLCEEQTKMKPFFTDNFAHKPKLASSVRFRPETARCRIDFITTWLTWGENYHLITA